MRQCVSTATLGALLASALSFNAAAADASSWDGDARSAMRLVAGSPLGADGSLRAGVEIRLATGWKTYWRYPGDSGVPPVFDFSKSENIKSVSIVWPAPHRFTDDSGASCRPRKPEPAGDVAPHPRLCGLRKALRSCKRRGHPGARIDALPSRFAAQGGGGAGAQRGARRRGRTLWHRGGAPGAWKPLPARCRRNRSAGDGSARLVR